MKRILIWAIVGGWVSLHSMEEKSDAAKRMTRSQEAVPCGVYCADNFDTNYFRLKNEMLRKQSKSLGNLAQAGYSPNIQRIVQEVSKASEKTSSIATIEAKK